MVLHYGKIAEMRTGEGKTLVATLPAYLNALPGRGVHIITVNDYLASRDAGMDGQGVPLPRPHRGNDSLAGAARRKSAATTPATSCTAPTTSSVFDYLRDNMAMSAADRHQRGLNYARRRRSGLHPYR